MRSLVDVISWNREDGAMRPNGDGTAASRRHFATSKSLPPPLVGPSPPSDWPAGSRSRDLECFEELGADVDL